MNYSKQRDLVLKTLKEMANHPSVDAIYENVRKKLPSISLATVYRNLNQLAENNVILRIDGLDGSVHFDHQVHNHYHFICNKCNEVFDVPFDVAPNLKDQVEKETGFLIENAELSFKGLCHKCRKQAN